MLGLLALDPERVTRFVTAILSCLGGYLAGFVLAGVCAYFLDRWLTRGRSPKGMHSAARHIGGIAGAVLIALMVFGGFGDGEGAGGTGTTGITAPGDGGTEADPRRRRPRSRNRRRLSPPPAEPEKPIEETLQVTVLSGSEVRNERFYQVGDDPQPTDLAGVQERIRAKRLAPGNLSIAIRLTPRTDRNNSGVKSLETWARDAGMRVILPRKE